MYGSRIDSVGGRLHFRASAMAVPSRLPVTKPTKARSAKPLESPDSRLSPLLFPTRSIHHMPTLSRPGGPVRRNLLALLTCTLTALPLVAQAQSREVTGRITTAGTGTPLQDATVTVIGQQAGARTNERGEYRVRVTGGDVTLTARALGYKRQEQRVPASSQTANFVLERDVLQLEGMTITGAATAVDRRN